ncbi:hypothetical protein HZI73_00590 [Vallitalea pronyensis]|uniref:Fibronectin type-III domain-containing protein n=1 Tax=Vallitalea pronyensis TaxID=1348613 RepID=A0A8J8MG02_9FIRM|nr:kelch repeat-containing protein [Vallitalea pronyensis]QUI20895.1 hypothetical protein HZI73_00590 [Vallitalea pronyensis]
MKKLKYFVILLLTIKCFTLAAYASTIPPTNILTTANDNRIVISWDAVHDAIAYEIEVDGVIIDNHHYTIFEHDYLLPLTTHEYRVRVTTSSGTSDWSPIITQKTSNPKLTTLNTLKVSQELIQPRYGFKTITVDDKIFIIGGYGQGYVDTIETFDHEANHWDIITSLPTTRLQPAVVAHENKIYVIGGYNQTDQELGTIDVYDLTHDTWSNITPMPTKRSGAASIVQHNKIYVLGGYNQEAKSLDTVEVYDIATQSWTTIEAMPTKRSQLAAVLYDNKIYAMGGYNGFVLGDIETYDIATHTWTKKGQMPIGRYAFDAMGMNNRIMIIGGYNTTPFNTIEHYNPMDNRFITQNNLMEERYALGAALIKDQLYVIGGSNEALALSSVEKAYIKRDPAPTNFILQESSDTLNLSWDKMDEMTLYDVEINGESIQTGFKNTYTLDKIKENKVYHIRVRGITNNGVTQWTTFKTYIKYANQPSAYAYIGERIKDEDNYETIDLYIMTKHIEDIYTVEIEALYNEEHIHIASEDINRVIFSSHNNTYQYLNLDDNGRIYILASLTGNKQQITNLTQLYKIKLQLNTLESTQIDIKKINIVDATGHILDIADIYDLDMPSLY